MKGGRLNKFFFPRWLMLVNRSGYVQLKTKLFDQSFGAVT